MLDKEEVVVNSFNHLRDILKPSGGCGTKSKCRSARSKCMFINAHNHMPVPLQTSKST